MPGGYLISARCLEIDFEHVFWVGQENALPRIEQL